MASNNIARLGVVLGLDTAEFTAEVDKAIAVNQKMANAIKRDTNAAAGELINLKHATEDYGKALSKVELIQREVTSGRFMNATADMKQRLLDQAAAYDKIAASQKKVTGELTQQQKIQLTYQTTDLFTQIASGQSPLIAILQQGGQLKDVMGGLGPMFRALGTLITPFTVSMTTLAVVVGATAKAAYDADKELDKLKDTLTLTGNYSKVTVESFQKMAETLSGATNSSLATTKEALMAVIASGQFTGESIGAVTQSIITYSQIAGISATEAAQKLKSGLNGTAEGAKSLNKEMNFLTLEQYRQVEALEKANKKQEAAQLVAVALNTKLEQQRRELGLLEKAWNSTTNAMSDYWDKFKQLLSGPTQSQTLSAIDKQISDIEQKLSGTAEDEDTVFARGWRKTLASLKASKESILEIQRLQNQSTTRKDVGNAKEQIDEYDKYKEMYKAKAYELEKSKNDAAFKLAEVGTNELEKLQLESAKKIADAQNEMRQNNIKEDGRATAQNLEIYKNKVIAISTEVAEKINLIRRKEKIDIAKAQVEQEQNLIDMNNSYAQMVATQQFEAREKTRLLELSKEDLELKNKMIYASEKEVQLAELAVKYRRLREGANADPVRLEQLQRQQQIEEFMIQTQDTMRKTSQVFDSVWGNMSAAIDNFVRTGKFSMKDFAASVIRDLIAIQMKAAALTFLRYMFTPSPMAMTQSQFVAASGGRAFADGGEPPVGMASLVGERGPELFVPKTAGTIIPNNQLGGLGGQTINYNGPIIQNMSAIDTQSALQFLSKNKQAVWAANQSAQRSLPMSR
jgi:phage-related minor tail protein